MAPSQLVRKLIFPLGFLTVAGIFTLTYQNRRTFGQDEAAQRRAEGERRTMEFHEKMAARQNTKNS